MPDCPSRQLGLTPIVSPSQPRISSTLFLTVGPCSVMPPRHILAQPVVVSMQPSTPPPDLTVVWIATVPCCASVQFDTVSVDFEMIMPTSVFTSFTTGTVVQTADSAANSPVTLSCPIVDDAYLPPGFTTLQVGRYYLPKCLYDQDLGILATRIITTAALIILFSVLELLPPPSAAVSLVVAVTTRRCISFHLSVVTATRV